MPRHYLKKTNCGRQHKTLKAIRDAMKIYQMEYRPDDCSEHNEVLMGPHVTRVLPAVYFY